MNRHDAEALRTDKKNWTFGVIYACRDDPRVIVRNRLPIGWTWNFAHPFVWPVLLASTVFVLAPAAVLWLAGVINPLTIMLATTASVLVLVGIAHHIASGPR